MGGFRDHKSHLQVDRPHSVGNWWFKTMLPSLFDLFRRGQTWDPEEKGRISRSISSACTGWVGRTICGLFLYKNSGPSDKTNRSQTQNKRSWSFPQRRLTCASPPHRKERLLQVHSGNRHINGKKSYQNLHSRENPLVEALN